MIHSDKPIDMAGIAALLGVSPYTPGQWQQRGQLPAPDLAYPGKHLWYPQTIINWAKDTERWPPGRVARRPRSEQNFKAKAATT